MTTFLFNESDGTTLAQIDPKWAGSISNIVTSNGTVTVDTRNTDFKAWYVDTYGSITHSSMQYERLSVSRGETCYPSVQTTADRNGYTLVMWNDGRVYVDRNGSWGGYFDDLRNVFDPMTTDFVLTATYDESTGLLIGTVNGVEAGRLTDGSPMTGGYPGFNCGWPVLANDQSRNSAWSNEATIAFPAPFTPSNLVASLVNPYTVNLTWTDNSSDETAFVIEMESPENSGDWNEVATTGANATSRSISGLNGSTSYRFRMRADGLGPSSPYVVSNGVTTAEPVTPPTAPTTIVVSNITEQTADVSWTDTSANEDDYLIQIATPTGSENWINATLSSQNPLPANTTSATLINLIGGNSYDVKVIARNLGGSAEEISPPFSTDVVTIPNAPEIVVGAMVSDDAVTLHWISGSNNQTGFVVQYETPVGQNNWTNATGDANPTNKTALSFLATGFTPDTTVRFRVASVNSAGTSSYTLSEGLTTKSEKTPHIWVFDQPDGTELTSIDSRFWVSAENTIITNQGALSQNIRNSVNRAFMSSPQGVVQTSTAYIDSDSPSSWIDVCVCATELTGGYSFGFDSGLPAFYKQGSFLARGSTAVDTTTAPYYYSIEFDSSTGALVGKHNDVVVLSFTDSSPLSGGYPGFILGGIQADPPTSVQGPLISWTDEVTSEILPPDPPVMVRVDSISSTGATLRWINGDSTTKYFEIERLVNDNGGWVSSPGINNPAAANANFHTTSGLFPLDSCVFRIRSVNSAGASSWVESDGFTTPPSSLVTPMLVMYPF